MSEHMNLSPDSSATAGQPIISRTKGPTGFFEPYSRWSRQMIEKQRGGELEELLEEVLDQVEPQLIRWEEFFDTGGKADLFVGVFIGRCLGIAIRPPVMGRIWQSRLHLTLDIYSKVAAGEMTDEELASLEREGESPEADE